MKITTWNINSVRLRIDSVVRFLNDEEPDYLCLQEIKCHTDQFPSKAFTAAGYAHHAVHGQGGHHGVAIVAKKPFKKMDRLFFCGKEDARHVEVTTAEGVRLHNFYVPAGGDEPDPEKNEKFDHKLKFLTEMRDMPGPSARGKAVLVGDLNVAPTENDVWSHKQLLKVVSHTPIETDLLNELISAGKWVDTARALIPEPEKLYSWWSYRARDWAASNRGRRLDHIWVSPALKKAALALGPSAIQFHTDCRGWEKPSDHAPVSLTLDL